MNKQKYELFFDMDGVLYPLDKVVIDQYNIDFNENYNWKDNTKFNWQDTKGPVEYFENLLTKPGTFLKGVPTEETVFYLNKLHEEGYKIRILTFPLWNNNCPADKIAYLKLHFPWINVDKDVIMTGDKGICALPNRILIDDNPENIVSWTEAGGIAIPFKNFGIPIGPDNKFETVKQLYEYISSLN
jgi:5'(3')-deoxyribonucleotidase